MHRTHTPVCLCNVQVLCESVIRSYHSRTLLGAPQRSEVTLLFYDATTNCKSEKLNVLSDIGVITFVCLEVLLFFQSTTI